MKRGDRGFNASSAPAGCFAECCRFLGVQLQGPGEISGQKDGKKGRDAGTGAPHRAHSLGQGLQQEPHPTHHHLSPAELGHPLCSSDHNLQPGPEIFPDESIIKRSPNYFCSGHSFFRLKEASHTVSIIMNLLAWKR